MKIVVCKANFYPLEYLLNMDIDLYFHCRRKMEMTNIICMAYMKYKNVSSIYRYRCSYI